MERPQFLPEEAPACLADYARAARALLPGDVWEYLDGGAGDESTVRANRTAFGRVALRPRVLVDVSERTAATSVLGTEVAAPIVVAPMAYHRLVHSDGESATARAAGAQGLITTVSTFSSQSLEDVARAATGPLWFQLYCFRDRSVTRDLLQRAEESGSRALVLTVDTPLMGRRPRDIRNAFQLPDGVRPANFAAAAGGAPGRSEVAELTRALVNPAMTWSDLAWLREASRLPLVLKGVLTAADAARAAAEGVDGLIVSNHGGRQLDGTVATLDALPEVADAADGRCEILLDGGVRAGSDVLKALALGARAVLVGRPVLWGLAVDGERGVTRVLRLLMEETDIAMAVCGCPTLTDVNRRLAR